MFTIRKHLKTGIQNEGLDKIGDLWHSRLDECGRADPPRRKVRAGVAPLQPRLDRSLGENERLEQEITRLQKSLEDAMRKRKRNTAAFSRDNPKLNPKTAARKLGDQYGQQATPPTPLKVDEQIAVPLPPCCPHCES
jgi:hypothetical protein